MRTMATDLVLAVLLMYSAPGYGQPTRPAPGEFLRDGAATVVNMVPIAGPPEAVFDLVTTARFWPRWHPATRAVSGVTERPYRLGDRIHERGRIGDRDFQVTWTVVEHVRPSRVVLRTERPPAQITYSLYAHDGATIFTRELKYTVENPAAAAPIPNELDRLMRAQSEQAVNQLKALIERILREEAIEAR